jgi:hypothetical protein
VKIRVVLKYGLPALVAALFVLPLSAGAAPTSPLTRVSQDRLIDTIGLHQSEFEPSLASAPGSKTLVSVSEVGVAFDGGASSLGWTTSVNGGKSWKHGLIPLTIIAGGPATGIGPVYRAADPSAAWNARYAKWLSVATGLGSAANNLGLYVNSSTDGKSWSAPSLAHGSATGDTPSRASLTCDNNGASAGYGNCYIAYTNTTSSPANQLFVLRSSDGGATWSAPVGSTDTSVGTGPSAEVQPPPPSAAPGSTCGRVVISYAGSTTNISDLTSSDCGVTFGPHVSVATVATHTVAQGLHVVLAPSTSTDKAGAIYLVYHTRSFRITQTTLSAAANAGDTNIKVGSVTGMVAGNTLTVDTGASAETVTITTVGTAGASGTGITFTPALASAHALGAVVTVNGVASTSTAAPNDIAMAVMPGPTDAVPAPNFGAASRIPIESDAGATTNTVDHFIPAIAADGSTSGASAHLALFYYSYPVASCAFITGAPLDNSFGAQCAPQFGYVSSTNGGSTWSAPLTLASMQSTAILVRTTSGPDLGIYTSATVIPTGPLAGKAISVFADGIPVNGIDQSLYVPSHGLTVGGGS